MSQYKTGTAAVTSGSNIVTGSGTAWLTNLQPGDGFTIASTGIAYDVAQVVSDAELQLSAPYTGASASGLAYAAWRDFTAPDGIPEMSQGDIETATIFTRAMRKVQGLISTSEKASDARDEAVSAASTATTKATEASQSAAQAGVFRDQASQISGLATVEQAVDVAIPQAPALLDGLRRSVEAASGGRMTVFYTAGGRPSYFVRQPKFLCEDVAPGGELGTGVHEAFLFDGVADAEIWVGAYQGVVLNGEAVSQPGLAPGVSINYDNARSACQAAGAGFDLMSVWDWAAISLWCMARGFQPRGNTNYGRHHDNRWETGTRQDGDTYAPGDSAGIGNILGGSGPAEWRHDGTMSGISDLVGNVWEWLSGMKMVDGRVFLSPDNSIPSESGYSDTLFDLPSNRNWSTVDATGANDALKRSLIAPKGVDDPLGYLYTNLTGERLPFRGGNRHTAGAAGLAALYLSNDRALASTGIGFRPRFRNP